MNVVHFRNPGQEKSTLEFEYNGSKSISVYKYLGVIMDEHLNFESCSKTLADSGSGTLSAIISHLKTFKNIGFKIYTKMYESCIVPVLDYASGLWGKCNELI